MTTSSKTVWCVIDGLEGDFIGAFSTQEKALKAAKEVYAAEEWPVVEDEFEIREVVIDA